MAYNSVSNDAKIIRQFPTKGQGVDKILKWFEISFNFKITVIAALHAEHP
jgi:hypothetical protein